MAALVRCAARMCHFRYKMVTCSKTGVSFGRKIRSGKIGSEAGSAERIAGRRTEGSTSQSRERLTIGRAEQLVRRSSQTEGGSETHPIRPMTSMGFAEFMIGRAFARPVGSTYELTPRCSGGSLLPRAGQTADHPPVAGEHALVLLPSEVAGAASVVGTSAHAICGSILTSKRVHCFCR